MNRNNLVIFGLIAFFVVGVGLTALLLLAPKGNTPSPTAGPAPTPIPTVHWVARRDIPPRTIITSDMLIESSEGPAPTGATTDAKMVIGRISSTPITKGEVVTTSMTTPELARVVPASMRIPSQDVRAVAIWVDPVQTAAGLVDKGDRIDVIAAHRLKVKGADGDGEVVSGRTIGQDLEVLAVDRSISAIPQPTPGTGGPGGDPVTAGPGAGSPPPQPTPAPAPGQKINARVIVAAPPEVAERLVAANLQGELHITIRDPLARDTGPIAEVREYPVRGSDPLAQKLREAAVQDTIEARRSRRSLAMDIQRQQAMNKINKANLPQIPPADLNKVNTIVVPTAPPTNEITVVRGTEKTRVVVPR